MAHWEHLALTYPNPAKLLNGGMCQPTQKVTEVFYNPTRNLFFVREKLANFGTFWPNF